MGKECMVWVPSITMTVPSTNRAYLIKPVLSSVFHGYYFIFSLVNVMDNVYEIKKLKQLKGKLHNAVHMYTGCIGCMIC